MREKVKAIVVIFVCLLAMPVLGFLVVASYITLWLRK